MKCIQVSIYGVRKYIGKFLNNPLLLKNCQYFKRIAFCFPTLPDTKYCIIDIIRGFSTKLVNVWIRIRFSGHDCCRRQWNKLTSPLHAETATLEFGWPWTMPWKWQFLDLSLGFDLECVSLFLLSTTRAGAKKFRTGSSINRCSLSCRDMLKCTWPSSWKLVRLWEM